MLTKEQAYQKISLLVERFEEQIDSYKRSDYNETLTRRDIIDPFFKALGLDVDNVQGNVEAYRQVTLTTDLTFKSPSGACDFCIGSSNNGWDVWKDENGLTLDEVYKGKLK